MKKLLMVFAAAAFASCASMHHTTLKQKVIFKGKAFHPIGDPQRVYLTEGDTLELLISNYKIKLKHQ